MENLIVKFWAGKATKNECKELLHQLEHSSDDLKNELEQTFFAEQAKFSSQLNDQKFAEILLKIKAKVQIEVVDDHKQRHFPFNSFTKWMVAAMLLIGMGLGFQHYFHRDISNSPALLSRSKALEKRWIEIASGKQPKIFMLPDGSMVKLLANSRITYEENFGITTRNLRLLKGEASFKVTKNKLLPFEVKAKGISTTALGTEFIVSYYAHNNIKIKLLEGKVVVSGSDSNKHQLIRSYLTPGQLLVVNYISGHTERSNFTKTIVKKRQDAQASLKSDQLSFNKEPLSRVFATLSDHYQVKFSYDTESLSQLFFTGAFKETDSLQFVLNNLCEINNLTYSEDGNIINIKKRTKKT